MGKTKKLNTRQQPSEKPGKKRFASGTVSLKKAKTRKEKRKEERQAKKVRRLEFQSHRSKAKASEPASKGQQVKTGTTKPDAAIQQKPKPKAPRPEKKKAQDKTMWDKIAESRREWKEEEKLLKKEMRQTRRRRLLGDAAADDDKTIRKAEKILRLNKKSKIPASFREDGLDYLLELVSSVGKDGKKPGEQEESGAGAEGVSARRSKGDAMEDDLMSEDEELSSDGNFDELEDDSEENDDDFNASDLDEDDAVGMEDVQDSGAEEEETGSQESNVEYEDEDSSNEIEEDEFDDGLEDDVTETADFAEAGSAPRQNSKLPKGFWEDIYGRLRDKSGAVVDETTLEPKTEVTPKTGKYVPPAKRGNESGRQKILRTLKGLMNRLSEGNMHSVAKQVEDLYMSTSRNEMNELLLELLYTSLLTQTVMPDRLVLEHVMLVAILHANVGSEVGAYFIQNFVEKFRELYEKYSNMEESKELQNVMSMISAMYHFKVVGSKLMFDILEFLASDFNIKSVELILSVLRAIGFRLRKDDPIQLKTLILKIQEKASKEDTDSSRVRFMLEVLMAIKNNNMSKIPNYDPSHGEHLQKAIKQHFHKGNYVTELMICMEDLLKAETKGRWWLVGSAWSNVGANYQEPQNAGTSTISPAVTLANKKLLAKAKKFGMNTDTRRSIFCVIMSAEDYLDAYEKLMHLGLRNQQAREMVHVLLYCCLHEKAYNPYYCLILEKLCSAERHFMLTLQYSLWDRLKDFASLSTAQLENMSSLLVNLINSRTLPITVLKVMDFADMNKDRLGFLKQTLGGILLQKDQTNLEEIIVKTGSSETLHLFRESLRLFFGHFMLKESIDIDGEIIKCPWEPVTKKLLESRIKVAENALQIGKGRLLL